jgi:hypothetical protein
MYILLAALAAFVVSTFTLIENGGGDIGAAQPTSLHDLTSQVERYRGRNVQVEGVLHLNPLNDEYLLFDGDQNYAVTVRGFRVAEYDGQAVQVDGKFDSRPGIGPVIENAGIRPTSPTPTPKAI